MTRLFRLPDSLPRDAAVDAWLHEHSDGLGTIAAHWFDVMRRCGPDVRERMHDGCPTACVADAAFAYVAVFREHVNVGFFRGAELPDPAGILQGSGRRMRHVKLRAEDDVDVESLSGMIRVAYADIRQRIGHDAEKTP